MIGDKLPPNDIDTELVYIVAYGHFVAVLGMYVCEHRDVSMTLTKLLSKQECSAFCYESYAGVALVDIVELIADISVKKSHRYMDLGDGVYFFSRKVLHQYYPRIYSNTCCHFAFHAGVNSVRELLDDGYKIYDINGEDVCERMARL